MVVTEGGPCAACEATTSSLWYGRKNGPKYCKKRACLREGGYLKRSYTPPAEIPVGRRVGDDEPDFVSPGTRISEIYSCHGLRCAAMHSTLRLLAITPVSCLDCRTC